MDFLGKAIAFAAEAHSGMKRKGSDAPYILHPLEAAAIVGTMTDDCEVIAAAVLHDVVEDTAVSIEEIAGKFGDRVAELVAADSENKREDQAPELTWRIRKEETIQHLHNTKDIAAKMVVLGDKLSNIRSLYRDRLAIGDAIWQRFNQKDPREHAWYYGSIAKAMPELMKFPAWVEYDRLVSEVFGDYID